MTTKKTNTQVADCCVELLHAEIVNHIINERNLPKDKSYAILENLGFTVGQKLAARLTRERPLFADNLDIIKFICKDLWIEIYKKQIDNLRTNRRGTYVLNDVKFRYLAKLSSSDVTESTERAQLYVIFPCGIIRGALTALGVDAYVTAEIVKLPACLFIQNTREELMMR